MTPVATVTVAQAAAQTAEFPGTFGEFISRLTVWDGRVYAGYGDYNGVPSSPHGTGPIDVVSAPADASFGSDGFSSEATLHTQQIWHFRKGQSGRLWAAYMDPIRGPQGDITVGRDLADGSFAYAYADEPNAWTVDQVIHPYAQHCMGMVETPEALFIAGAFISDDESQQGPAIWKSTDRGATWTADLLVNVADGFDRMYCFFDWGDGTLTAVASGMSQPPRTWFREVGGDWVEYDDPLSAMWADGGTGVYADILMGFAARASDAHLFSYQGTPIQLVNGNAKQTGGVGTSQAYLLVYGKPDTDPAILAAAQAALPSTGRFLDVSVSDDGQRAYLYRAGSLRRGDTDFNWETIATWDRQYGDEGMVVDEDGGYFYVGTHDSKVSQFALPT